MSADDYIVAIDLAQADSVQTDHYAVQILQKIGERWVVVDDPRYCS